VGCSEGIHSAEIPKLCRSVLRRGTFLFQIKYIYMTLPKVISMSRGRTG